MIISIDLDGTAWRHREFFGAFARAMKKDGHKVGILTSHEDTIAGADMALFKARFGIEADFWIGRKVNEGFENHKDWKVLKLKEFNIDYHFDDWAILQAVELFCNRGCPE